MTISTTEYHRVVSCFLSRRFHPKCRQIRFAWKTCRDAAGQIKTRSVHRSGNGSDSPSATVFLVETPALATCPSFLSGSEPEFQVPPNAQILSQVLNEAFFPFKEGRSLAMQFFLFRPQLLKSSLNATLQFFFLCGDFLYFFYFFLQPDFVIWWNGDGSSFLWMPNPSRLRDLLEDLSLSFRRHRHFGPARPNHKLVLLIKTRKSYN